MKRNEYRMRQYMYIYMRIKWQEIDKMASRVRLESQKMMEKLAISNLISFLVIIAQKWDWMHDLYFQSVYISDIREQILG